jgi:hypothetical protein
MADDKLSQAGKTGLAAQASARLNRALAAA